MRGISRRDFLRGASLLPVVSFLPRDFVAAALVRKGPFLVLNDHQAAVVEEATARLIPGPRDDPNEVGHPGAREAKVVRYIDAMLGALERSPERVFAGGPFSDRAGGRGDDMRRFVRLDDPERLAWRGRLRRVRRQYAAGVRGRLRAPIPRSSRAPTATPSRTPTRARWAASRTSHKPSAVPAFTGTPRPPGSGTSTSGSEAFSAPSTEPT